MDRNWQTAVEWAFNEGLKQASTELHRHRRICVKALVISLADDRKSKRLSVEQEFSVGILAPFSGKASGLLSFLLPWNSVQRVWAETLGFAPLTTHDLTSEHLAVLIEMANHWCKGFCESGLAVSGFDANPSSASLALDMPMTILQTLAIEAARRKMSVMPFKFELHVADNHLEGQAFVAMREGRMKLMRMNKEVAA